MTIHPSLAAVRDALRRARASSAAAAAVDAGRHLDIAFVNQTIDMLVRHVEESSPTVRCPWCSSRGCRSCHGTGWVPRSVRDRAPDALSNGATDEHGD